MNLAEILHNRISEVCPIDGISIGVAEDKSTWRIDFRKEATSDQRKTAQEVLAAFDKVAEQDASNAAQAASDPSTQIAHLTAALIKAGNLQAEDLPAAQVDAANEILASSGVDTIPVLNAQPVKVGL